MNTYLEIAKRLKALADAGLTYSDNEFDLDRYTEISEISDKMITGLTGLTPKEIKDAFIHERSYPTPKVDIRAFVIKDNKLLMVREKTDGKWAMPGGWGDIGYSPNEVAVKETIEESGYQVKTKGLMAVSDKKRHNYPPSVYYVYKLFIECEIVGGKGTAGNETSDVGFFPEDNLPELSLNRNTKEQIALLFKQYRDPARKVLCD
jgi:ADP-ribose pyrophosphatase YjhB (NUDIX family)